MDDASEKHPLVRLADYGQVLPQRDRLGLYRFYT